MGSVAVVIAAYNAEAWLSSQLEALLVQDLPSDTVIVVADNGSSDHTRQIAENASSVDRRVIVVDASARQGPAFARNVGVRATTAEKILFCDADDIVRPGWATALLRALDSFAIVAGTTGNGSARQSQDRRYGFLPGAPTRNLGIRRDAFDAVGGFDEDLLAGEDIDLCWRVQLAGFVMGEAPGAEVVIRPRYTLRALFRQEFGYGRADVRLYRKHRANGMPPSRTRRTAFRWAVMFVTAPRLVMGRRDRRRRWVAHAGKNLGRTIESVTGGQPWYL